MLRAAALAQALALALAAAPLSAQETLPDGYPPRIGEISGRLGETPVAWETFDFSVGAFDASVWIDPHDDGLKLKLIGYPPGQPQADDGRILIQVALTQPPVAGMIFDRRAVLVEIYDHGQSGPRLSSRSKAAEVELDRVTIPAGETSGYGRVSGRYSAELCPRGGKNGACRVIAGRFDTAMQFTLPEG